MRAIDAFKVDKFISNLNAKQLIDEEIKIQ